MLWYSKSDLVKDLEEYFKSWSEIDNNVVGKQYISRIQKDIQILLSRTK